MACYLMTMTMMTTVWMTVLAGQVVQSATWTLDDERLAEAVAAADDVTTIWIHSSHSTPHVFGAMRSARIDVNVVSIGSYANANAAAAAEHCCSAKLYYHWTMVV